MGIDFSPDRWLNIKETYRKWWAGELDRPILPVILDGRDPGRKEPDVPFLTQATCTDLSIPPEAAIDRIDYELSKRVYLGDAFPAFNMDCFGPGILAAFLGADIKNDTGNVWFFPKEQMPISEIHFEYDSENVWLRRLKDLYVAGMDRWQGSVLMGMTDIGGNLDILSVFRPGELLPMDLIMEPEEVKRLTWEAHEAWHKCFDELNSILQPMNPGYTAWCGIFSDEPYYMLQCDFCYMIGPKMFDEFVKPELEATAKRLSRSFYHLDGRGQLPHLDSLLTIEEIGGVQWVVGAREFDNGHKPWIDLYKRVHDAGKKIQLITFQGFDEVEAVIEGIDGDAGAIHHFWILGQLDQEPDMRRNLERFGIE